MPSSPEMGQENLFEARGLTFTLREIVLSCDHSELTGTCRRGFRIDAVGGSENPLLVDNRASTGMTPTALLLKEHLQRDLPGELELLRRVSTENIRTGLLWVATLESEADCRETEGQ